MKLTRLPPAVRFDSPFGRVDFVPASPGHKVFFLPKGTDTPRRVHWLDGDATPSRNLALFFIRKSVAEDRGLNPYTYTDSNTDPV